MASSCSTNIYIVRHAEKENNTEESGLTDAGRARAEALDVFLADKKITQIFSTKYNRTKKTAEPTALRYRLQTQEYGSDTLNLFVDKHLKSLGKNVLVVGHSNTIRCIADRFETTPPPCTQERWIAENDFDNLIIIKRWWSGSGTRTEIEYTTYGAPSPQQ